MTDKAIFEGRNYSGRWKCEIDIPDGWSAVRSGVTMDGDRCVILDTFRQVQPTCGPAIIPAQWEAIRPGKIGMPVSHFRAVIRNGKDRS